MLILFDLGFSWTLKGRVNCYLTRIHQGIFNPNRFPQRPGTYWNLQAWTPLTSTASAGKSNCSTPGFSIGQVPLAIGPTSPVDWYSFHYSSQVLWYKNGSWIVKRPGVVLALFPPSGLHQYRRDYQVTLVFTPAMWRALGEGHNKRIGPSTFQDKGGSFGIPKTKGVPIILMLGPGGAFSN